MLNLAFPPERVVHQVAAILLPEASSSSSSGGGGATNKTATIGGVWADYLVEHGFAAPVDKAQVEDDLVDAITANTYFASIHDLVAAYPSFKCIWNDDGCKNGGAVTKPWEESDIVKEFMGGGGQSHTSY